MELFLFSCAITGAATAIAAISEYFDWMDSYERAAAEQKAENFDG